MNFGPIKKAEVYWAPVRGIEGSFALILEELGKRPPHDFQGTTGIHFCLDIDLVNILERVYFTFRL